MRLLQWVKFSNHSTHFCTKVWLGGNVQPLANGHGQLSPIVNSRKLHPVVSARYVKCSWCIVLRICSASWPFSIGDNNTLPCWQGGGCRAQTGHGALSVQKLRYTRETAYGSRSKTFICISSLWHIFSNDRSQLSCLWWEKLGCRNRSVGKITKSIPKTEAP